MEANVNIVPCSSIAHVSALLRTEAELYVVHDRNVAQIAEEVASALPSVKRVIEIETSEALKTMVTVQGIVRQLLEGGATRGALLLAIGGGITTDLAGFAAAIYKRGIRWAALPTTLVGQVDAAIGGKTGANLCGYKNMVGAFHMPEATYIVPSALEGLPERELRAGVAEMLKTFLIGNGAAYKEAVTGAKLPLFAHEAAKIKGLIVAEDPFEHGKRALLNLGHTFGHAIEHRAQKCGHDILHGEAVAMGIIMAAKVSEVEGLAEKGLANSLEADFRAAGLPTESPYPIEELAQAMALDKKAGGGKVKFILLEAPGKPFIKEMTVEKAIDDLRKYSE